MLNCLLIWMSSPTYALGGSFAGPLGIDPPASTATEIVVATRTDPELGERTAISVTAQAAQDVEGLAWLWPAPGYIDGTLQPVSSEGIEAIEAFTRPRVEEILCEELVDTLRYRTPPGCASYDVPIDDGPLRGEDAVGEVALEATHPGALSEWAVLDPTTVGQWLSDRDLDLTPAVEEGLQPYFDAGYPVVALYVEELVPRGGWLPVMRFEVQGRLNDVMLPLSAWAAEQSTNHEIYIYTMVDDLTVDPAISNLEPQAIENRCQLPPDMELEDLWSETVARFRGLPSAPWFRVFASPAEVCAPCTSDPLPPGPMADLGIGGEELVNYRAGRIYLRTAPGQLSADPVLTFTTPAADEALTWISPQAGLGFAFPVCGEEPDPTDVCEEVQTEETRGCSVSPGAIAPWPLGLALALLLGIRRRRSAALVVTATLGLGLAASPAHALDDGFLDRRPVWEATITSGLFGTDRVRVGIDDAGGPSLSSPFLGVQGRWAFFGWKDGANVGLAAGVRGFRGELTPSGDTLQPVRFTLVEPSLGLDVRHGMLSRSSALSPFFRYGARLALPVLDPDVSAGQVAVTGLVHVGAGLWFGSHRNKVWPIAELQLAVAPRTDGFVTEFHPALDLPQFTFFPGTANLQLVVGVGFP